MRDRLSEIRTALAEAAGEDINMFSMSRVTRDAVDLMHRLICQRETLEPPAKPKEDWSKSWWESLARFSNTLPPQLPQSQNYKK
jgi:hypothetical protein